MAKYRPVLTSIWKDPDFEDYNSSQKLIFMHGFTNQSTTESGIYGMSLKAISNETGLTLKEVEKEISSIKNIVYDYKFKCIFIVKFLKHNGGGRPDLLHLSILKDAKTFPSFLWHLFIKEYPQHYTSDLKEIISKYPLPDASVLKTSSMSKSITNDPFIKGSSTVSKGIKISNELRELCVNITKHLNEKAGKQYQPFSKIMIKYLSARKNDGYAQEQFIQVIDTKVPQWINTKMEHNLSPDVLFSGKMEKYLQENIKKKPAFDKRKAPTYKCHICNVAHHWGDPDTKKCEDAEVKARIVKNKKKQDALKK
jgi:uncharacterized phage protein (TIGR02220 family)